MPKNVASMSVTDFDLESSNTQYSVGPITVGNFTAKRAAIDTLRLAQNDLMGTDISSVKITEAFSYPVGTVADHYVQRETKWLVTYKDITQFLDVGNTINNVGFGNIYTLEIPCADLPIGIGAGKETIIDLTVNPGLAYKTAFEAVQNSPTGGNEVELLEIKHVGRNL